MPGVATPGTDSVVGLRRNDHICTIGSESNSDDDRAERLLAIPDVVV